MHIVDRKYEWVNFYQQHLFSQILSFEEKQNELALNLKSFKEQVGHRFEPDKILDENGNLIDDPKHHTEIDPFTVLGLINVGTLHKRSKLHSLLLGLEGFDADLTSSVESDAQSVWYYPFKFKKKGNDVHERSKDTVSRLAMHNI